MKKDTKTGRADSTSQFSGWDGLSKSKMEFCYCDEIPRKVKKSVIKALEERNTEDARKMANLLKSIEAKDQPNREMTCNGAKPEQSGE